MGEMREYPLSGLRVCLNDCRYDLQGSAYSRMQSEPLDFHNCMELLLGADRLFDQRGYPQSYQDRRSFREAKKSRCMRSFIARPTRIKESLEIMERTGTCGYFDIFVETRMRSGWQGFLIWPDGNMKHQFSGERELLSKLSQIAVWYDNQSEEEVG